MTDWNLVIKIAGGGFGITILVLTILSLIVWIMGLVIQKIHSKDKETPVKDK